MKYKEIILDNLSWIFASFSIILLGSIFLAIITPKEKIHQTEVYTVDESDYVDMLLFNTYQNRVDRVESQVLSNRALIKDLNENLKAMGQENDNIADLILFFLNEVNSPEADELIEKAESIKEENNEGTFFTWPPKIKLHFKSPSSTD